MNPVNQPYDIVAYVNAVDLIIQTIIERGRSVVVVGGSGFYLKSFFSPVIDTVAVSDAIRSDVADIYENEGLDRLLAALHERNPNGLGSLDTMNPRRVQRALERCIAAGKSLPELQAEFAARPEPYGEYEKRFILLERDAEELRDRVARRVDQMIEQGLIYEVERLRALGIDQNPCAASAIGYRETLAYLSGEINREDLAQAITQSTNRLVKKQRTWFRTQIRKPDETIVF